MNELLRRPYWYCGTIVAMITVCLPVFGQRGSQRYSRTPSADTHVTVESVEITLPQIACGQPQRVWVVIGEIGDKQYPADYDSVKKNWTGPTRKFDIKKDGASVRFAGQRSDCKPAKDWRADPEPAKHAYIGIFEFTCSAASTADINVDVTP